MWKISPILMLLPLLSPACGDAADVKALAPREGGPASDDEYFSHSEFYVQGESIDDDIVRSGRTYVCTLAELSLSGAFRVREVFHGGDWSDPRVEEDLTEDGREVTHFKVDIDWVDPIEFYVDPFRLRETLATFPTLPAEMDWSLPRGVGLTLLIDPDGQTVFGFQNLPEGSYGHPAGVVRLGSHSKYHAITGPARDPGLASWAGAGTGTIQVHIQDFSSQVSARTAAVSLASGPDGSHGSSRLLVSETDDGAFVIWSALVGSADL